MNRRRIRAGRGLVVATALLVAPLVLPAAASADPIEDQKALVARVTDQLEALETKSDILAENLVTALDEKTQLDAQVAEAEQQVAAQQAAVEALRAQLSQVAVQAYMGAGTSSSSPMFNSSEDVTDSLARDQLARVAMSAGAATTDEYDEAVKALQTEQAKLDEARAAAAAKAEQITSDQAATSEQTEEYKQARAEAESKLGDLIQQEEERRARESYEQLQREAEQAAAAQRAAQQQAAARQQQAPAAGTGSGGGDSSSNSSSNNSSNNSTNSSSNNAERGPRRGGQPGARLLPGGVVTRRHRRQRRDEPARHALRRLQVQPGRGVRLLGPDDVGMGAGRRRPPPPVTSAVRQPPARAQGGRPTGRSAVLLLADQPCLDVPRRRHAGPCAGDR